MIGRLRDAVKRRWPALRLRAILFTVLVFAAAMPGIGAISLRVYENTLVRQTEAELVAQGAAMAAAAAQAWPGAPPHRPPPRRPPPGYYRPERTSIDLSRSRVLPERPAPRRTRVAPDPDAVAASEAITPMVEETVRTTLASVVFLDRHGIIVNRARPGSLAELPEVRWALSGRAKTVFRRSGAYHPEYDFEWLSRASALRLHHARPIVVDGKVVGVLLLNRSPRALFRGIYEDRGKIAIAVGVIFGVLVVLAGVVSRGVTRPIERLSAASRDMAAGVSGAAPETPPTAAVEIRALYDDFRAMAERIERRSGYLRDVAAAVSHEFKTPLAGITGAVELLQDHYETMSADERRRFLDNIAADSERLSQLVTRLLDLARADMAAPEAGAVSGLDGPVRRAVDGETGPTFRVEVALPPDLPPVAVPAATLDSVLTVLLQNSRQAGASAARLTASVSRDEVTVTVADDGPGVPEADRERLFEPFFTSHREDGGTGLGLPIARSLLAASHAAIELAPSERGATFVVTLPAAA